MSFAIPDRLREARGWVPQLGSGPPMKYGHQLWVPASYQKLDDCMPEAAHFGDLPKLNGKYSYDPLFDTYDYEPDIHAESSLPFLLSAVFGSIVTIHAFRALLLCPWRGSIRRLLTQHLGSDPDPIRNYSRLRNAFKETEFFKGSEIRSHSHGVAAGHRAAVTRFMSAMCTAIGCSQYSFQLSKRDQSQNMRGHRTYYWAKDVNAFPQFDVTENSDVVCFTDVDYYVDMPQHLCDNALPHLIYTVQPETAGRIGDDYSYSFNAAGEMLFRVSGGATYSHRVWNYGTDWFTVSSTFLGIPYKTVVYDVQARRTSPDKQLVLLSPMKISYGLSAIIAWWMGRPLLRLAPTIAGGFSKVKAVIDDVKYVSVARFGLETSCTVTASVFESLVSVKNISPKASLNLYQVKSLLTDEDVKKDLHGPILTDYFNNAKDVHVDEIQVVDMPKMTQFSFTTPDPSDKPAMAAFMNPYVPTAFVPVNNESNSTASIAGRVILPRIQAETLLGEFKMTATKQEAIQRFAERLMPTPHLGVPLDFDSIRERQTKPGQKRDLEDAGFIGKFTKIVKTFMKREAYGKPNDPRNITTFNPKAKIDYAGYMYALMEHIKEQPFYAFGKPPVWVANRVAEIASCSNTVACPDISRMDGFVNEFCRKVEEAVGSRFFAPEYVDGFLAAHKLAFNNVGITTHGVRYDQEFSRGSGEMGTSYWNTVLNLFMIFYTKYCECGDWDVAWKFLLDKVLAGGDDGLVGDIDDRALIRGARNVGFILKCPIFFRGDVGVNFLARIYGPMVWDGDASSMCSLKRQLEKFHLTVECTLQPQQKLFEKSVSFSLTDSQTPVIGSLVRKVLQLAPGFATTGTITRFGDEWDRSEQYPNLYAGWMEDVANAELPLVNIPDLEEWISGTTSLDELLNAPTFYEEGREFTWEDWDPVPGLLIAKTVETLSVKVPPPKRQKALSNDAPTEGKTKKSDATAGFFIQTDKGKVAVDGG
jgi:hypothetical protein